MKLFTPGLLSLLSPPRHARRSLVSTATATFDHARFDDWKRLHLEDALRKLDELPEEVQIHESVYALLLRKCGAAKDLESGKHVHLRMAQGDRTLDRYLANMLVEMYGKCGSLTLAHSVFKQIPDGNVFSWTMLIAAYAQNGHPREAVRLYVRMQSEGVLPDKVLFVTVLDACTACGDLDTGRVVHSSILGCGEVNNLVVANALLNMYGKCGEVGEAEGIFQRMTVKDVVSWTAMLVVYAHNARWSQAFECFHGMDVEGVKPNQVTFVSMVDVCAKLRMVEFGRLIHERLVSEGMEPDTILGNALVHMYGNCGSFEQMKDVFDKMAQSSVLLWTTMISGCAQNGRYVEGMLLFRRMDLEGVKPNEITYMSTVEVCRNLEDALKEARVLDARIGESPFRGSLVLGTSLITLYGRFGVLDRARELLEDMYERDVVAWNSMIAACAQNGESSEALRLFRLMDVEGYHANKVTYLSLLEACANLESLARGVEIHARLMQTGLLDVQVALGNSLITMYGRCGSLENVRSVFESMSSKDDVSWNAVINASVGNGDFEAGMKLFHRMDLEGERANEFTALSVLEACGGLGRVTLGRGVHARVTGGGFAGGATTAVKNSIMSMYAKCGSVEEASREFDELEEKSVISWSIMLGAVAQSKQHGRRAFRLLKQMEAEGIKVGEVTLVSALDACATMATLEQGKLMHRRAVESGYFPASPVVGNTIINMYGRCGSPYDSRLVFDQMRERCSITWNSMIVAFSHNSHPEEAHSLLGEMLLEGLTPDNGTSVSLLYGFSHAGLLKQGVEHFKSSVSDHGLVPNSSQYKCLVDLLGRKGFLAAGEELIETMPCEPDSVAWMALLAACRSYGDSERGVRCAERVLELEPEHAGSYVMLSNIYSSVGRFADAARVRKLMQEMNVKKEAGCSWIELEGNVHEFVSGGGKQHHPRWKEIEAELESLRLRMKVAGYVPDLTAVVHDVDEQEKEEILARHSERQAIVLGLISTPPGSTIRIVKNLRVCSDCHEASKIISKVVGREIVVRDSSRFHHFRGGTCSCKDFW